jgi:hypothetical protein
VSASRLISGRVVVVTAGTRVQFTEQAQTGVLSGTVGGPTEQIIIQALSTNTGAVTVGDATVVAAVGTQGSPTQVGIRLTAGQTLILSTDDLDDVWLDSATSGDGVSFVATERS